MPVSARERPDTAQSPYSRRLEGKGGGLRCIDETRCEVLGALEYVTLSGSDSIFVKGEVLISVQHGCANVDGALVLPSHGPLLLSRPATYRGGPATVSAGALNTTGPLSKCILHFASARTVSDTAADLPLYSSDAEWLIWRVKDTSGVAEASNSLSSHACPSPRRTLPSPAPPPPEWGEVLEALAASSQGFEPDAHAAGSPPPHAQSSVIVVVGPKHVGKSTFARRLINRLLREHEVVGFLDSDAGQPELTPPGVVSLSYVSRPRLSPPPAGQLDPHSCYFVGDISPASDPERYIACVGELFKQHRAYCSKAAQAAASAEMPLLARPPPLVLNTHGWTRGYGRDILAAILHYHVRVTHSVHLVPADVTKALLPEDIWTGNANLSGSAPPRHVHVLPGLVLEGASMAVADTPVQTRLRMWSVFAKRCVANAQRLGEQVDDGDVSGVGKVMAPGMASTSTNTDIGDQLAAAVPFIAPLDEKLRVCVLHGGVPPELIPAALNCSIVGLCSSASTACAPALCLGLAIVRGVDAANRVLYLLTPAPLKTLERVDCLQLGRLELPSTFLHTGQSRSPYIALGCISGAGTGATQAKSRNNLQRSGQKA